MEQVWWTAFVDFERQASRPQRACVIVRPENLPFLDFAPTPPASNDKAGLLAMIRVGLNPITQSEITMRTTPQLSITLPLDMADVVKAKVRTGEYATESEVIRDGLRALLARDRAVESWLNHQVGPAYDALKADPARAVTVDQVRARLAAEHAKAR